jgi:hypothetical protein
MECCTVILQDSRHSKPSLKDSILDVRKLDIKYIHLVIIMSRDMKPQCGAAAADFQFQLSLFCPRKLSHDHTFLFFKKLGSCSEI